MLAGDCAVRDLPEGDTELFSEVTPLREVAACVKARKLRLVLVGEGALRTLRGVVQGDAVLRLADRIPDAPVGMLPTQHVIMIPPATTLGEAMNALTTSDAGIAVEHLGTWTVLTREQLASWSRARGPLPNT